MTNRTTRDIDLDAKAAVCAAAALAEQHGITSALNRVYNTCRVQPISIEEREQLFAVAQELHRLEFRHQGGEVDFRGKPYAQQVPA